MLMSNAKKTWSFKHIEKEGYLYCNSVKVMIMIANIYILLVNKNVHKTAYAATWLNWEKPVDFSDN